MFLLAAENLPFTVSIVLMLAIAALEGVTSLFGAGLSHLIDSFVPDVDMDVDPDLDVDGGGVLGGDSALSSVLGWLSVGKVPLLVLLVIFLTIFGFAGLVLQTAVQSVTGALLPGWLASVPALLVALPTMRLCGRVIGKFIPKDESSAVSRKTFIGRVATITLGTATKGNPAQGKLHDEHGQAHYVMIEPDIAGETFAVGEKIILVAGTGGLFRGR